MNKIALTVQRYLNEEPVAVGAGIVAALIVAVSLITGTPVESVVAQVVALLGVFATVRASVTPYFVTDDEEYDGPVTPEEAAAYFDDEDLEALEPTKEDYGPYPWPLERPTNDEGTNPPR